MLAFAIPIPFLSLLVFGTLAAFPEANAQTVGTIRKLDFDAPNKPDEATYKVVQFKITKPNVAQAHVILRQFSRRVRVEFEGSGLPKGQYAIAISSGCEKGQVKAARYKSVWRELHRFESNPVNIATEKSLPGASLRDPASETRLEGKALALFKVSRGNYAVLDCQVVR